MTKVTHKTMILRRKLTIENVPHVIFPEGELIHDSVNYLLSVISNYMEEKGLTHFDYNNHYDYPEIQQHIDKRR